jgi:hypothetical protein
MNSLPLTFGCGFEGTATGTEASPTLAAVISGVARVSFSGSGKQCYVGTQTIAVSGTNVLDLTSGLVSPLNENITGAQQFDAIYGVFIEHRLTSLATSGVTALGGGGNEFQGPFAAGDKATLLPGQWLAFGCDATGNGWDVSATIRLISLVNLDAVADHIGTVAVFLLGTVPP